MDGEQAFTLVEYNIWANHKVNVKAAHLTPTEPFAETSLRQSSGFLDFIKFVAKVEHA
jgi:hypothetical protein